MKGKSVWQLIRETGDSMGKSVLAECFRENESVDWFANIIMDHMFNGKTTFFSIENALFKLLKCLDYGDKATMKYDKIRRDLKKSKRNFDSLSFKFIYKNDKAFDEITSTLFEAFCAKKPDEALYSELEYAGIQFFSKYKGSKVVQEEFDNGSDSEFSAEISEVSTYNESDGKSDADSQSEESDSESDANSDSEESNDQIDSQDIHFSHSKLRVCSGMKAIMLAHYGALSYLRENGIKKYRQDVEQMYYEVENALTMVKDQEPVKNKVRAGLNESILHYDLNHCNAANAAANVSLATKLADTTPSIVVLDYTSSTLPEIREALKICFSQIEMKLIIMVDSGLKNNQGGHDYNPYGEVRIVARDRKTRNSIVEKIKKGLSKADKLSPETHEMVRSCKLRGLALSLLGFFKHKPKPTQTAKNPEANHTKRYSR